MAILQKTRPKQMQSNEMQSLFTTDLCTEVQSAQFVKKLLAVGVSNLMYLRAIFPEGAFTERELDGLRLKVLRDNATCPNADRLTAWVKACFDAIDKKYLRQVTVLIYRDEMKPDCVIETYTFRFAYTADGSVTMQHANSTVSAGPSLSSEKTYQATVRMFRTIMFLCQNLSSLPDDCFISMKLLYYDDVTPADYEPSGFRAGDNHQVYFEGKAVEVRVGDVATRHHHVKLRVKTSDSRLIHEDEDEVMEENSEQQPLPPANQEEEVVTGADCAAAVPEDSALPRLADSVCGKSPAKPASGIDNTGTPAAGAPGSELSDVVSPVGPESEPDNNNNNNIEQQEQEEDGERGHGDVEHVRCPCGVDEDDGLMVLCDVCNTWQHGICFLILHDTEAPSSHVCDLCSMSSGRPCTDSKLPPLPRATRLATCLYRRGLCACEEFSRVTVSAMARRMGVEKSVAEGLVSRLEKDGVLIKVPNKGEVRRVNKTVLLQQAFPRYLNRSHHDSKRLSQQLNLSSNSQSSPNKKRICELPRVRITADLEWNSSNRTPRSLFGGSSCRPGELAFGRPGKGLWSPRHSTAEDRNVNGDAGDISQRTEKLSLNAIPRDGAGDFLDSSVIERSRPRRDKRPLSAKYALTLDSSQEFQETAPRRSRDNQETKEPARKRHKVSRVDGIRV